MVTLWDLLAVMALAVLVGMALLWLADTIAEHFNKDD